MTDGEAFFPLTLELDFTDFFVRKFGDVPTGTNENIFASPSAKRTALFSFTCTSTKRDDTETDGELFENRTKPGHCRQGRPEPHRDYNRQAYGQTKGNRGMK